MTRRYTARTTVESPALLVARHPLGEADLIVRLFTESHGMVSAIARNALRSHKRFPALEPMHLLGVRLELGERDLATLVEARLERPRIAATMRSMGQRLELAVRTDVVTPFFHAELRGTEGHFRGDWQVLRPGRIYRLLWAPHDERYGRRGTDATRLSVARRNLRTLSLYDLYEH